MIGGVGFSKLGQTSFHDNQKLRLKRPGLWGNPYQASGSERGILNPEAYQEIQEWKLRKANRIRRLRQWVWWLVLPLIALLAGLSVYLVY